MNEVFGVARVPLIGAISGADSLRQAPRDNSNNRYMFNVRASYANETEAIVNQLVSLGITKIAVFYQNDGFGRSGLDGVAVSYTHLDVYKRQGCATSSQPPDPGFLASLVVTGLSCAVVGPECTRPRVC